MFRHGAVLLPLAALNFSSRLMGQATDATPAPAARLEQLDSTYSSNLRKYHAPVILDYLRDLEKLRQTLASQSRDADAAQVQAEIDKTKKLSSSTGLLSYDPLKPPPEPEASVSPSKPPPGKGGRRFSPDAITLSIANAINARPSADTVKPAPDDKALPLGHAEWRIDKLPAGVYEVMLISSVIDNSEKQTVEATLGSYTGERKVRTAATANGPNDFRIFRVATFSLDQDMSNTVLTLESSDPSHPCLWVRNVVLTHPKPPPSGGKRPPPPDGPPPGVKPAGPGGPGGPPPPPSN
jgi:hypothetical protein